MNVIKLPSLLAAAAEGMQKAKSDASLSQFSVSASSNEPIASVFKFADGQVYAQLNDFPRLTFEKAKEATLPVRCGARDAYLPIVPHYSEVNGEGSLRAFVGKYYPDLPLECKVIVGMGLRDVSARIIPVSAQAPSEEERAALLALDYARVARIGTEDEDKQKTIGTTRMWRDEDWDTVLSEQATEVSLNQYLRSHNMQALSTFHAQKQPQPDIFLVLPVESREQMKRIHYTLQSLNLTLLTRVFIMVDGGDIAGEEGEAATPFGSVEEDVKLVNTLMGHFPNMVVLRLDAELSPDADEGTAAPSPALSAAQIQQTLNNPAAKLTAANIIIRLIKDGMVEEEQAKVQAAKAKAEEDEDEGEREQAKREPYRTTHPMIDAENDIYIMLNPDVAYTRNTVDAFIAEALAEPLAAISAGESLQEDAHIFGLPTVRPISVADGLAVRGRHLDMPVAKRLAAIPHCSGQSDLILGLLAKLSDAPLVRLGDGIRWDKAEEIERKLRKEKVKDEGQPTVVKSALQASSATLPFYTAKQAIRFPGTEAPSSSEAQGCEGNLSKHLVAWNTQNKRLKSRQEFIKQ